MRMNEYYAYISIMKARLNITVDEHLLNNAKHYAAKNDTSLSQLIELYFESLTRPARRKNIIQLIDKLPKPKIDLTKDMKQAYYEDQKEKYGF
jgi:predicted MPP superfamily phosphohydrolase